MRLRPGTEADRDAVLALCVAEERVWFGRPENSAEEAGEWIDDEGGMPTGAAAVDDDGRVCGFASPGRHEGVFVADPARTDAVSDLLLPWVRARRSDVGLLVFGADADRVSAFERHGLRHERSSFSLARAADAGPLPPAAVPDGVTVAPYRLGEDDEAVHGLIYVDAAWAALPGHAERDLASWRRTMQACTTMFLAMRGERPVGWVAGRVLETGRGYVSSIAVATGERGHGLGRALLLLALADLRDAGDGALALDAWAHNEAALGLYRSVGLQVEREWRLYRA